MPMSHAERGRLGGLKRAYSQTAEQRHEQARKLYLAGAVKAVVDRAPELTDDQRAKIRAILLSALPADKTTAARGHVRAAARPLRRRVQRKVGVMVDHDPAIHRDEHEPAGHVNRQWPELPTDRHRDLMALLRAHSHRDSAGRLVSWWPQAKLAAALGVSVRTLRNVLADLRQPGYDPRHPRGTPPGLRLGYVTVEPTTYRDRTTGRRRLGRNLYVLVERGQQATGQQATPPEPISAPMGSGLVKGREGSALLEGRGLGLLFVSAVEAGPQPGGKLERPLGERPCRRREPAQDHGTRRPDSVSEMARMHPFGPRYGSA